MINHLLKILNEIIDLLIECDLLEQAAWFKQKKDLIEFNKENNLEFRKQVHDLQKILAGMGSFSDLPMVPKAESKMSEKEAERLQLQLTEKLFQEIKRFS